MNRSLFPRTRKIFNFVAFQVAWFACAAGAAQGYPLLGLAVVLGWVSVQLVFTENTVREIAVIVGVVVLGAAVDATLVAVGATSFAQSAVPGTLSPVWKLALWANFAATLGSSLGWLAGRYWLAAALGTIGGPLAYYGAAGLGAVELSAPLYRSLGAVAVAWTIAVPLCFALRTLVMGCCRGTAPAVESPRRTPVIPAG